MITWHFNLARPLPKQNEQTAGSLHPLRHATQSCQSQHTWFRNDGSLVEVHEPAKLIYTRRLGPETTALRSAVKMEGRVANSICQNGLEASCTKHDSLTDFATPPPLIRTTRQEFVFIPFCQVSRPGRTTCAWVGLPSFLPYARAPPLVAFLGRRSRRGFGACGVLVRTLASCPRTASAPAWSGTKLHLSVFYMLLLLLLSLLLLLLLFFFFLSLLFLFLFLFFLLLLQT